jgi:hypothetical protein
MIRRTFVQLKKFIKRIPIGYRVFASLIFGGWFIASGLFGVLFRAMLWLPIRDITLDTRPNDDLSATRLAFTVARAADCGRFEVTETDRFLCHIKTDDLTDSFREIKISTWTHTDQTALNEREKINLEMDYYVAGPFYDVYGGTPEQLARFPGTIVYSQKKVKTPSQKP